MAGVSRRWKPGTRFKTYKIERCLSARRSSWAYVAQHTPLKRDVFLKVIPTRDPRAASQFKDEIRALSRLRHPNNVRILDAGIVGLEGEELMYLATELAPGETLRRVLQRERRLGIGRSLRLTRQVLRGLSEAHGQGIVHRDLKPENVLVCAHAHLPEHVLLVDYGLAVLGAASDVTQPPQRGEKPVGTLQYASPERVLGQGGEPTVGADIYSVGAMLYECLAGVRLFGEDEEASPERLAARIVREEPPRLRTRVPVSSELEAVVHRALARDPEARYASADAMLEALEALELSVEVSYDVPRGQPEQVQEALETTDLARPMELETPLPALDVGVASDRLWSTQDVVMWVSGNDPVVLDEVLSALRRLELPVVLRVIGNDEARSMAARLHDGAEAPPWLVVFGEMDVAFGAPLLEALQAYGEVARVLVAHEPTMTIVQDACALGGLSGVVQWPADDGMFRSVLDDAITQTRIRRQMVDALRIDLRDAKRDAATLSSRLAGRSAVDVS